jgi:hypothetical protein
MVSTGSVIQAVSDVLDKGSTNALGSRPETDRSGSTQVWTEEQFLSDDPFSGRRSGAISEREIVRALLSMHQTVPSSAQAPPRLTGGPSVAAEPCDTSEKCDGIVVGRRRQHRLDIELVKGSLLDIPSRAYVLGVYDNVAPSGPAFQLDMEMNGAVSEFFSRRLFSCETGRISVMPTGHNALRADFILFAGLGQYDRFQDDPASIQHLVSQNAIRALIRSGIDELATVVFGGGSGQNVARSLPHLIQGFLEGLTSIDSDHRFRRVTLCENEPTRYCELRDELYRLAATSLFDDVEVTIDEREYPSSGLGQRRDRISTWLPPDIAQPTYLTVRMEDVPQGDPSTWREDTTTSLLASVLAPDGKATVFAARCDIKPQDLDQHLATLDSSDLPADLTAFGTKLAELVLPQDIRQVLAEERLLQTPLTVIHDTLASRIPWETLRIAGTAPAVKGGLSRRYMAENLSIAKWLEQRMTGPSLDILLIINPTEDLSGTEYESKLVSGALQSIPSVKTTIWRREQATKHAILDAFASGEFDVVHYAGHAFFDPDNRGGSGIICHNDEVIGGDDLLSIDRLPALVFFNACESARVRGRRGAALRETLNAVARQDGDDKKKPEASHIQHGASLAESFLRSGVTQFVGTWWPVGDATAAAFAAAFYRDLTELKCRSEDSENDEPRYATVGEAILTGRAAIQTEHSDSPDWADYIHYGDPNFPLKLVSSRQS